MQTLMHSPAAHFTRHYVEMVVAMFAGMFVLGIPLVFALGLVGVDVGSWDETNKELMLLGMAFVMSVPMAAWMRYRGHGWAPTWEMVAAMFVPSALAIGLLWAGSVTSSEALMTIQHVGMFPAMLAVMLLRLGEYTRHHG